MSTFSKLWIKLRDNAYRHAFAATQLKRGIPFQFRAMRKKLGLSQADLARLADVSQGVISRAEDPDYGNLTFNTVLRIAKGMDCAFVGRLVPFSDLAKWFDNLSEESVQVSTFEEEDRMFEELGPAVDYHLITVPTAPIVSAGVLSLYDLMKGDCSWTSVIVQPYPAVGANITVQTLSAGPTSSPASTDARAANSQLGLAA